MSGFMRSAAGATGAARSRCAGMPQAGPVAVVHHPRAGRQLPGRAGPRRTQRPGVQPGYRRACAVGGTRARGHHLAPPRAGLHGDENGRSTGMPRASWRPPARKGCRSCRRRKWPRRPPLPGRRRWLPAGPGMSSSATRSWSTRVVAAHGPAPEDHRPARRGPARRVPAGPAAEPSRAPPYHGQLTVAAAVVRSQYRGQSVCP
jgi:hypothetical protein